MLSSFSTSARLQLVGVGRMVGRGHMVSTGGIGGLEAESF